MCIRDSVESVTPDGTRDYSLSLEISTWNVFASSIIFMTLTLGSIHVTFYAPNKTCFVLCKAQLAFCINLHCITYSTGRHIDWFEKL